MNMSRTIHVIDDDDLARDVISSLVATLPGVSVSAWDSAERFLTAAQEGAAPGVVLLDLNMPGLSGNEALQACCAKDPGRAYDVVGIALAKDPSIGRIAQPVLGELNRVLIVSGFLAPMTTDRHGVLRAPPIGTQSKGETCPRTTTPFI